MQSLLNVNHVESVISVVICTYENEWFLEKRICFFVRNSCYFMRRKGEISSRIIRLDEVGGSGNFEQILL